MRKKHPWLCAGTAAMALLLCQQPLLAEEPPQEEKVEIEVTESVQQVAEQAAEAAKAIAAEAAAEAQETAAEIAAEAAEHAREAAEEVTKAAGELNMTLGGATYQTGLYVSPLPKSLDAQLKLEGKGILIDSVEKDGAGEQAGIRAHDIVIKVEDKDVASPAEYAKVIRNSEGKALRFDLLRGGEKLTISVQPRGVAKAIRPYLPKIEFDEEIIELESKIREKLKGAGVDVRMHIIHPGQTMPTDVLLRRADVPEGVSISVRREGGKPAIVEVSRGEEKWDLSEEELDKLPNDLRPHVDRMLGKFTAPFPPGVVAAVKAPVAERHLAAKAKVERATWEHQLAANQVILDSIARSVQEIKKDIHRLYDQIDELRDDRKKD